MPFPKGISTQLDLIARVESAVQHFSNYATGPQFIWTIDGILTGTTPLGQSEPGGNGSDEVLHTLQISRTGA